MVPPKDPEAKNPGLFNTFHWHLSVPAFSLARFSPANSTLYPVGTGKAAILRTIAPNNRRVRCPSVSSNQKYRARLISRPS